MAQTQTISDNRRVAGTSFLTVDGSTFELGDDFEWSPSTPERATKKGLSGVYGFQEKPREGHMKGTAYRTPGGPSVTDVGNLTDTTLIASLADGTTVTLKDGWNVEPPVLNAAEGTFSFNVESGTVIEEAP